MIIMNSGNKEHLINFIGGLDFTNPFIISLTIFGLVILGCIIFGNNHHGDTI